MDAYPTRSRGALVVALILTSLSWLGQTPAAQANSITVTGAADTQSNDGQCTLREAILNANNNDQSGSTDCTAGGGASDTLSFAGNYTITLSSDLPGLNSALALDGTGQTVTISGNNSRRLFHILAGGEVSLNQLTLVNGSISDGGGILVETGAILTVTNSLLSGHSAVDDGGGIFNFGTLLVANSTLSGNSAESGGAIFNQGSLTLSNSTLSGNSAVSGGGIRNNGVLTINNSTLSGNLATNFGGGAFNFSGPLTLFNTTFSDNSATTGGGLFNQNTLNFSNSLIANSSNGGDCHNTGAIATNLNNLVEDGSCSAGATGFVSGDPHLRQLRDNGGSTFTHALLPGSPAINAGANGACLGTDQRNIGRPQQGSCDIGAFESRGFNISLVGGNNQSAAVDTAFNNPLTLIVGSAFGEPVGPGGGVRFTAPASGASLNPTIVTATTTVSGVANQIVTANSIIGNYSVTATANGINGSVSYTLTNTPCEFTITVTTTSDSGPGSLRQALAEVCQGGTMVFNSSLAKKTVLLAAELKISKLVTINNPHAPALQISGNNSVRVFNILSGGQLTLDRLDIISGSTTGVGGGILIASDAIVTVTNSTLAGNSAVRGGGIDNRGTLSLRNSTLSGNSATGAGGGIRNRGDLTMINTTLSNNSSASSGGLLNRATMNFSNSLIANSSSGGDCDNSGTIATNLNNLVEDGGCDDNATSFIVSDPRLGPLQDNGGPTLTHALLPGSPAVNGGDNGSAAGLNFDQRGPGFPRIRGANVDIGAFESRFTTVLYLPRISKNF